jgi:septum formation protein
VALIASQPRIILGSASPRRVALLRQLALPFEQVVSPAAEPAPGDHPPEAFVVESACTKARSVRHLLLGRGRGERPFIVIGADTAVVLDGGIFGKPADAEEAVSMLRALSGRTHQVYTGLALACSEGRELRDYAATRVRVRHLTEGDIRGYVATGEPLDKAGAYGIQGLGARFIESIEGCYYNVVGLPLERLGALLEAAGYQFVHPNQRTVDSR